MPLAIHIYLSIYSRFIADDYCSAALAQSKGILPASSYLYITWSGRFSANVLDALAGIAGPWISRFFQGLFILLWTSFLAIFWNTEFQALHGKWMRIALSLGASALILATTFHISPSIVQSLYWGQGMRSVVPPLVLGTLVICIIQYSLDIPQKSRGIQALSIAGFAIAFLASGFNESFAAVQSFLLAIPIILWLANRLGDHWGRFKPTPQLVNTIRPQWRLSASMNKSHSARIVLTSTFLGSIAGLILTIAAPGNAIRQAFFPPAPSPYSILKIAVLSLGRFVIRDFFSSQNVPSLLGLIIFALWVGYLQRKAESSVSLVRDSIRSSITAGLLAVIALLSVFLPAAYGISNAPPDRTLIIPVFMLVSLLFWVGNEIVRRIPSKITSKVRWAFILESAIIGLVLLNSAQLTAKVLSRQPVLADYSLYWDARDVEIRKAKLDGRPLITVPLTKNWAGLDDLTSDPQFWVNRCASDYYGITVLAVTQH